MMIRIIFGIFLFFIIFTFVIWLSMAKFQENYIKDLEEHARDTSIEVEFNDSMNGAGDKYFMEVDNKFFGIKDKNDKLIDINTLLGDSPVNFAENILGIYLPRVEIENSIKYGWFQHESVSNIRISSIYISKYFNN